MSTHKPVDWTKELQTNSGQKARLLGALETKAEYKRVVAVMAESGSEWVGIYNEAGQFTANYDNNPSNLINPPARIKREFWLNISPSRLTAYSTRDLANSLSGDDRLACVKVTIDCAEGEGL